MRNSPVPKRYLLFLICLVIPMMGFSQNVYKTPTGKKYHLESCRMVVNVSKKLLSTNDIAAYNLGPCKICKPPVRGQVTAGNAFSNKAVGEAATVRCKGFTQQGLQCKRMTRIANGYCFQHTSQDGASKASSGVYSPATPTPTCGARTKAGGFCKRKVKGGGRCYQHR